MEVFTLIVALIAAALIAAAETPPNPTAGPTDVVPSPVETATPANSIELDGTDVSYDHVRELFTAFQEARTSPRIVINIIGKPSSAMPNGALWHYAGSKHAATHVDSWVWIDQNAPHTSEADQAAIASGMAAGMFLALMDSGFAGTFWKQFYDAEAVKDAAEAAAGGNAFAHRDAVAQRLGNALVNH